MKKARLFIASLCVLMVAACDNAPSSGDLMTETFNYADSSSYARLTTTVELPVPGQGKAAETIRARLLDVLDDQLCHIVRDDRRAFPAFKGERKNADEVVAYCHGKAFEVFSKKAQEDHEDYGEMPEYEYDCSIKKAEETDAYVIFESSDYCFLGGVHGGVLGRGPMTFNKTDGILVEQFLVPSCLNDIQPLIRNGLREYFSENGKKISNRELDKWLMLETNIIPFPAMSLKPSDEGLVFTYGQYEIAPYVAGMPSFTIPYSDISHYLTPEAKAILGGGQPDQPDGQADEAPAVQAAPRVYSCAFDGFVNMRQGPSYSAEKVGKFNNGPEGAILLEDLGEWKKIDADGVVGYVPSKYVQGTPTVAYTGSATADWVEGVWGDGNVLMVYNNGTWEYGYDYATSIGTYIMQNNEILFTPVWHEEDLPPFEGILEIDMARKRLGDFARKPFMSQEEKEEGLEEDMSFDYGAITKADFRKNGRDLLNRIEKINKNN